MDWQKYISRQFDIKYVLNISFHIFLDWQVNLYYIFE